MNVIGVVGGVGPYAGLDLLKKIFDQTDASRDQEHLPVSLLSYPNIIPDRTQFLLGNVKENPAEAMFEIVRQLEANGAVAAGVPCNTAHAPPIFDLLREKLKAAGSKVKLVHMIEEVAAQLRDAKGGIRRVAPLSTMGTYKLRVYFDALAGAGLEAVDPGPELQAKVHEAIYDLEWGIKAKTSPVTEKARAVISDAVKAMRDAGAQAVILGCTELPLAVPEAVLHGVPLVDPATALARGLIREAAPGRLRPI